MVFVTPLIVILAPLANTDYPSMSSEQEVFRFYLFNVALRVTQQSSERENPGLILPLILPSQQTSHPLELGNWQDNSISLSPIENDTSLL